MVVFRDGSRIRIKFPDIDLDQDGSAGNDDNAQYVCVTGNVSWSGMVRQTINTTCTESPADGWDNIIKTSKAGKFIDMGTLTFDVDFDPDSADLLNAAFRQPLNGYYSVHFPAEVNELAGPVMTFPGHFISFTPHTEALAEGDAGRSRATMVLKIAGDWVITDAVPV